ncbi:MAG: GNAT family N-acetyltransferase [Rhizobiales bacterium]|nr:GNAT family N-acetyltransferase [Hyphomicrobiales bacterium]
MESNIDDIPYIIRRANLTDAERISEISNISFHEYLSFTPASVRRIIGDHPQVSLLVAEYEGSVAGYIFTIPQDGSTDRVTFQADEQCVAQIAGLAVHPSFRGQAIGSALIDSALSAAAQFSGCRRIIAETNPTNVAAQSALLKAGFTALERLKAYYPDHVDAIRYERRLTLGRQPRLAPSRPGPH